VVRLVAALSEHDCNQLIEPLRLSITFSSELGCGQAPVRDLPRALVAFPTRKGCNRVTPRDFSLGSVAARPNHLIYIHCFKIRPLQVVQLVVRRPRILYLKGWSNVLKKDVQAWWHIIVIQNLKLAVKCTSFWCIMNKINLWSTYLCIGWSHITVWEHPFQKEN